MFKRFLAVFVARNYEFFRDRAALGWNLAFPILLVVGFAFIFKNDNPTLYKIGYLGELTTHGISEYKHLEFIEYPEQTQAIQKLRQHKLDLLVDFNTNQYWLNSSSANGYIAEKLLQGVSNHHTQLQLLLAQIYMQCTNAQALTLFVCDF